MNEELRKLKVIGLQQTYDALVKLEKAYDHSHVYISGLITDIIEHKVEIEMQLKKLGA